VALTVDARGGAAAATTLTSFGPRGGAAFDGLQAGRHAPLRLMRWPKQQLTAVRHLSDPRTGIRLLSARQMSDAALRHVNRLWIAMARTGLCLCDPVILGAGRKDASLAEAGMQFGALLCSE
jgi:hypothetical protein